MKKLLVTICLLTTLSAHAFQVKNSVSRYGWLDQYSMDSRHNFTGDEACIPTTSTNAMTYLQNANFGIFGSSLTGLGYNNWEKTDDYLIGAMGTTPGNGTYYHRFVYALNDYIRKTKEFPQVQFSGVFPRDTWLPSSGYPQPKYIQNGLPTIELLTNAVASGSAVLISMEYDNGKGHEILVNGIRWDEANQTGKLYFVDPLDPSRNYSPAIPTGPVKQTNGELTMDPSGKLVLRYSQYAGRLPYEEDHRENVKASLVGMLTVGGARFSQYGQTVRYGNSHAIAKGFDKLDPTTASMLPVLAVLNTSSAEQLNKAFKQLDPSVFNTILINEQEISLQTRKMITNNIRQYQQLCCFSHCGEEVRLWGAPYGEHIQRRSQNNHSGYRARVRGVVGGMDYFWNECLIGSGASFAKSDLNCNTAPASSDIRSLGAFLYGAWMQRHYWIDASFGYFNNKVHAKREVLIPSRITFIPAVTGEYTHKNNSCAFLGHLGGQYTVGCFTWDGFDFSFWPFINLDYLTAHHRKFTEEGGVLAYSIHSATQQVFLPEIGIGKSVNYPLDCGYLYFSHAALSYTQEVRCGGNTLSAHFCGTPHSRFTVAGLYPQNGYFSPSLIFGIKSSYDFFKLHVGYEGAYGPHLSINEFSGEVSLAF